MYKFPIISIGLLCLVFVVHSLNHPRSNLDFRENLKANPSILHLGSLHCRLVCNGNNGNSSSQNNEGNQPNFEQIIQNLTGSFGNANGLIGNSSNQNNEGNQLNFGQLIQNLTDFFGGANGNWSGLIGNSSSQDNEGHQPNFGQIIQNLTGSFGNANGNLNGFIRNLSNQNNEGHHLNFGQILQNLTGSFGHANGNLNGLIGILLNRANGFGGFVNRASNINDFIRGFSGTNGIIITTLERLSNNRSFRQLLQLLGAPFSLSNGSGNEISNFFGGEENLENSRRQFQELLQRLSFINGISSTPFGSLIFSLPSNTIGNLSSISNNPGGILLEISDIFSRLPLLSGIIIRTHEFLNHVREQGSSEGNSALTFFGPARFLETIEELFNNSVSKCNSSSENTSSASNQAPFASNIAEYLRQSGASRFVPGGDSNRAVDVIIRFLSRARETFGNSSNVNNNQQGPFIIRNISRLLGQAGGNNSAQNLNLVRLFHIFGSSAASFLESAAYDALNPEASSNSSASSLNGLSNNLAERIVNAVSQNGGDSFSNAAHEFGEVFNNAQNISRPNLVTVFQDQEERHEKKYKPSGGNQQTGTQKHGAIKGHEKSLPSKTATETGKTEIEGASSGNIGTGRNGIGGKTPKHNPEHAPVKSQDKFLQPKHYSKPSIHKAPPVHGDGGLGGTGVGGTGVGGAGPGSAGTGGNGIGGRNSKPSHEHASDHKTKVHTPVKEKYLHPKHYPKPPEPSPSKAPPVHEGDHSGGTGVGGTGVGGAGPGSAGTGGNGIGGRNSKPNHEHTLHQKTSNDNKHAAKSSISKTALTNKDSARTRGEDIYSGQEKPQYARSSHHEKDKHGDHEKTESKIQH